MGRDGEQGPAVSVPQPARGMHNRSRQARLCGFLARCTVRVRVPEFSERCQAQGALVRRAHLGNLTAALAPGRGDAKDCAPLLR